MDELKTDGLITFDGADYGSAVATEFGRHVAAALSSDDALLVGERAFGTGSGTDFVTDRPSPGNMIQLDVDSALHEFTAANTPI